MLKAVLLDVDGTLLDSNEAHAVAWSLSLHAFGYEVAPQRVREWVGMGGDKILPRVDASLTDDSEPGTSIAALRQRIFLDQYAGHLKPTGGARALLLRIGAEGVQRVVATSAKTDELRTLLEAAGVADQIDAATTSDDAERSKPDADIVETALRKARAGRLEAVYVGDTPYDVEASHRAGVPVIALTCGGWTAADLAHADAVYRDPADLLANFNASPLAR